ncbi:hypothetical protein EHS25_005722 [Saitozyma podzolica]|uniref:GP-PDE domain-containing protein n=1 Tax=Saitozyma podzolica TaxID=1890683 RepID=A0A427XW05_9TREE|nr:hypothetical protein EHS25_005722 [Saitozyma podzolica]
MQSTIARLSRVQWAKQWGWQMFNLNVATAAVAIVISSVPYQFKGQHAIDGIVLMFHDPTLDRTTTGTGLIREQPWKGVIEHVRTKKHPVQPIPLFEELIALLMEEGNRHVILNIDCKMQNDPEKLFPEMSRVISQYPLWETELAPRLILGLWHPLFLRPAYKYLPLCTRYHIGESVALVRKFFWDACQGFSMCFPLLMGAEGQQFLADCARPARRSASGRSTRKGR